MPDCYSLSTRSVLLTFILIAAISTIRLSLSKRERPDKERTGGLRDAFFNGDSALIRILDQFSIMSNLKSLLSTNVSSSEIHCINGLRFLTMGWIVLNHTLVTIHFETFDRFFKYADLVTPIAMQGLINSSVSVDTFFVISGALLTYSILRKTVSPKSTSLNSDNENSHQLNGVAYFLSRFVYTH